MKRNLIISTVLTVAAVAGSMFAFGFKPDQPLEATLLQRTVSSPMSSMRMESNMKVSAGYDLWITDVKSNFGLDGKFTFDQGPCRAYSTEISINGNKAKIKGLFDLWFDDVDKEYVLEGKYDTRSGLITIPVGQYDSNKQGMEGYMRAAEMYSLTTNEPYTLVVFAGDMTQDGNLSTKDELVFSVSEDMDRIVAKSGFGLYAFDSKGNPMAFYDYYKSCEFSLPYEGVKLSSSIDLLDFSGLFICTGIPQKGTVTIFNRGSEKTTLTAIPSSPILSVNTMEAELASGQRKDFQVTILPTEIGHVDEHICFNCDGGEDLIVKVDVDVYERPDYTLITKNGVENMIFEFSPEFPFVIAERDGKTVAVSINKSEAPYELTESWFSTTIDVPKGKVGILRYDGIQTNKQPNGFVITLDNAIVADFRYDVDTYDPVDIGGTMVIPEGNHTVGFSHVMLADWFVYSGIHGEVYISALDFSLIDASDNSAVIDNVDVTFDEAYFDSLTTTRESYVKLYNIGQEALRMTGFDATDGFSAKIPDQSVHHGAYMEVPVTWTVDRVGEANGSITLFTTAGDFTVNCKGFAKPVPEEFHSIVTKGDISFDTDSKYPFIFNDKRAYLYNSNSKIDCNDITNSWLDIMFEVPAGSIGKLYWDAYNDSEDEFYFNGVPAIVSGTTFTIDGENPKDVGGVGAHCQSSNLYTPGELLFSQGRHTLRINYKKTYSTPDRVYGDDRVKLFEISLDIIGDGEYKGYVTPEYCDFKGIEYTVERDGHQTIGLVNYTDTPVELLSWEHEGPFSLVDLSEYQYKGTAPFMIEYHPTKTGEETGSVTLHTNIGDYTVPCHAKGIDLNRGGRIFYESFEYGAEGWLFEDFDGDQLNWMEMSDLINEFEYNNTAIPYGYRAMGMVFYNYGTPDQWFDTPVDNVMFSPEIDIPENGDTFLQFICAGKIYEPYPLEVLVGVDADTYIDEYEPVFSQSFGAVGMWREYQINLSRYAGQKIRIAFRMKTESCYNAYFAMIDDILVTNSETPRIAGVNAITDDHREVIAVEWYTPEGLRLDEPQKGVNIEVRRWSDGSVTSLKSIIK